MFYSNTEVYLSSVCTKITCYFLFSLFSLFPAFASVLFPWSLLEPSDLQGATFLPQLLQRLDYSGTCLSSLPRILVVIAQSLRALLSAGKRTKNSRKGFRLIIVHCLLPFKWHFYVKRCFWYLFSVGNQDSF